jgi:hypothetical protein
MKKPKVIIITFFLLSATIVLGTQLMHRASAEYYDKSQPQFYQTQSPPQIEIGSPTFNGTYELSIPLNFIISYYETDPSYYVWGHHPIWLGYSLDGQPYVTIEASKTSSSVQSGSAWETLARGSTTVNVFLDSSFLSNGQHTITIRADFQYIIEQVNAGHYNFTFPSVSFVVDKPSIVVSILSPTYNIYNSSDIPLYFAVNRPTAGLSWMGYSLDSQPNITIYGNITLTGLTASSHSLIVFVNDTFGNMAESHTSQFTVATLAEPQSEPFPTLQVTVLIAIVAIVSAGLLVYFREHRKLAKNKLLFAKLCEYFI